jgi:Rad3-related DNA helicase
LNLQPIFAPQFLKDAILGEGKLVLMSGTLFPSDVKELVGDTDFAFLDLPSPIPMKNRTVHYRPISDKVNYETPPKVIAEAIKKVAGEHPGENMLVHLTYSDSKAVSAELGDFPVLTNTKENKAKKLKKFKEKGGVFLAAGCAEGLDLKDETCRVLYVPRLLRPNLGSPVVQKRRALEDGREWYDLQTLKSTLQQLGRAVRNETDYAHLEIGDPAFAALILRYIKKLPKSVTDAIKWTRD